ncbi:hypothetical protein EVAR_21174_1 [Eumeta japonica]|uniref:Uncharacterized protein n=1 Tax=Eumeta variegata TaxID=151549 RepID=A0A4C1UQD0_EUMVA|nr:hypothetical protein EVAR_21174_1 [Eumeta japonica]
MSFGVTVGTSSYGPGSALDFSYPNARAQTCLNLTEDQMPVCFNHTAQSIDVFIAHSGGRAPITTFVTESSKNNDLELYFHQYHHYHSFDIQPVTTTEWDESRYTAGNARGIDHFLPAERSSSSSSSSSSLNLQPVAMTERDKSRYTEGSVNIGGSVGSSSDSSDGSVEPAGIRATYAR